MSITVNSYGAFSIAEEVNGQEHRRSLLPGADVSNETQEVKDAAALYWTPAIISSYQAMLAANAPAPLTPEQVKAQAQATIDAQLLALDIKRIRPTTEGDTAYLATLNAQAVALRAQRATL